MPAAKPMSSSVAPKAGPPRSCLTARKVALIFCAVAVAAVALGVGLGLGLRRAFPTLSLPKLQPPVVAATPSGFKTVRRLARALQAASSLQTVKDRLFSPGPTDFTARIAKVDERLAEFATRSAEFQRKCVSATPLAWTPAGLPGGVSFPMAFQCKEALSGPGDLTLYFGVGADNFAYVAELQTALSSGVPRMAVLAKAPLDGSAVEVIQVMDNSATSGPTSTTWLYISANKTTVTMEVSVAATAAGVGVGCGVRLRAANSLVWAAGEFTDPFAPNACTGTTTSVCATGSTLVAQGTTACTASAAPTSTFTSSVTPALTAAAINSTATWAVADGIIRATGFPAVENFNTRA